MPGTALRIAASMTVAPLSTSTVRVSPEWSTKLILVIGCRVAEQITGNEEVRLSYNETIGPTPAVGAKRRTRRDSPVASGALQDRINCLANLIDGVIQRNPRLRRIGTLAKRGFQIGGGSGDVNGAYRPRGALQFVRQDRGIRRKLRQRGGQLGGLTGEHRQNLPFETVIAECHAMEMVEIDRP